MQIICGYLIICPDIVNAIRLCWSLVAERKGKSHFWDRKTAGFLEGRCWERWKWGGGAEWEASREKPSLFLKWEVCVYCIIYHDWDFVWIPLLHRVKRLLCVFLRLCKEINWFLPGLSCSGACHCLSVSPALFPVAIIKFILILHCQKPPAFFLVIRKHHLFAIPQELRIYTQLSSPVYANPQLHLNGIFRAFSEEQMKPKRKTRQNLCWKATFSTEQIYLVRILALHILSPPQTLWGHRGLSLMLMLLFLTFPCAL